LKIEREDPPAPYKPEDDELITICTFLNPPEANIAKGALESAGIECFLSDDNIVQVNWLLSTAVGNVKLQVRQEDAEAALQILDQPAENALPDEAPPIETS
jgi:hypothetical protein